MARLSRAPVAAVAAALTFMLVFSVAGEPAWASPGHSANATDDLLERATRVETPANPRVAKVLGKRPLKLPSGLYVAEVRGKTYTTHGPDPVPAEETTAPAGPEPERAPVCATSGKHVHLLYGYTPGSSLTNFGSTIVPHIRQIMRQNNHFINQAALESSGGQVGADVRVRCDGGGQIQVDAFEIVKLADDPKTSENESNWSVSDWRRIMAAGEKAGFNDPKVDYEVFTNAPGPSGIATWRPDERLSGKNENNNPGYPFGSGWAIVHASSWDRREVSLHELAHAMGAVQNAAPHSSGWAHCWDEQDTMCYWDGGPLMPSSMTYTCSVETFDCGYDDYFNTKPKAGSYLSSHWNLGSPLNAMIAFSGVSAPQGPTANFGYTCVVDDLPYFDCDFTSTSQKGDAALTEFKWDFGNGYRGSGSSVSQFFLSLVNGVTVSSYNVTLTVTDANGLESSVAKNVLLPLGGGTTGGGSTGGGSNTGGDDSQSASTTPRKTSVKIARVRHSGGRKVAVIVRASKGAKGRIKLKLRKGSRTREKSVRHRTGTKRTVRIAVPQGRSRLLVKFKGAGRWRSSAKRYRVKRSGKTITLRRF